MEDSRGLVDQVPKQNVKIWGQNARFLKSRYTNSEDSIEILEHLLCARPSGLQTLSNGWMDRWMVFHRAYWRLHLASEETKHWEAGVSPSLMNVRSRTQTQTPLTLVCHEREIQSRAPGSLTYYKALLVKAARFSSLEPLPSLWVPLSSFIFMLLIPWSHKTLLEVCGIFMLKSF